MLARHQATSERDKWARGDQLKFNWSWIKVEIDLKCSNWTLTIFGWLPSEVPCVLNLVMVGWNRHSTFQVALESNRSSIEVKPSSKQSGEDKPFEAAHDQWSMINDSIFIAPSLSYICWTALKINFRSSQEITILINDLKLPTDHRSMSQMINASIFTAMLSSPCRKGQFKELYAAINLWSKLRVKGQNSQKG